MEYRDQIVDALFRVDGLGSHDQIIPFSTFQLIRQSSPMTICELDAYRFTLQEVLERRLYLWGEAEMTRCGEIRQDRFDVRCILWCAEGGRGKVGQGSKNKIRQSDELED